MFQRLGVLYSLGVERYDTDSVIIILKLVRGKKDLECD